jgi:hypothetical protein
MHDLALERRHRIEPLRHSGPADLLGDPPAQFGKFLATARAVPAHVQHDPAARTSLAVYGQAGEFLQGLQNLATRADKLAQGRTDHGHDGPVALDVHVDVAVEIRHVEQTLDVVGRDLALLLQVGRGHRTLVRLRGFTVRRLVRYVALWNLFVTLRRHSLGRSLINCSLINC